MANNRVNIRNAVQSILSGNTTAGTNVYTNRSSSFWQSELPSILIETPEESAIVQNIQQSRYTRYLTLTLTVRCEHSDTVNDSVDSLLAEIEDLVSNSSLNGTVLGSVLTNTETTLNSEGETPVGVGTLSFTCKYIA